MLLVNFYKINNIIQFEDKHIVQIKLNSTHPIYEGHFPQQPIVPGVCTLQIIKECVQNITNKTLQYNQIQSCKFLSVINPIQNSELEVRLYINRTDEYTIMLLAEIAQNDLKFIKLKANLLQLNKVTI